MSVILETTLGDIVIDLFTNERPQGRKGTLFQVFLLWLLLLLLDDRLAPKRAF